MGFSTPQILLDKPRVVPTYPNVLSTARFFREIFLSTAGGRQVVPQKISPEHQPQILGWSFNTSHQLLEMMGLWLSKYISRLFGEGRKNSSHDRKGDPEQSSEQLEVGCFSLSQKWLHPIKMNSQLPTLKDISYFCSFFYLEIIGWWFSLLSQHALPLPSPKLKTPMLSPGLLGHCLWMGISPICYEVSCSKSKRWGKKSGRWDGGDLLMVWLVGSNPLVVNVAGSEHDLFFLFWFFFRRKQKIPSQKICRIFLCFQNYENSFCSIVFWMDSFSAWAMGCKLLKKTSLYPGIKGDTQIQQTKGRVQPKPSDVEMILLIGKIW